MGYNKRNKNLTLQEAFNKIELIEKSEEVAKNKLTKEEFEKRHKEIFGIDYDKAVAKHEKLKEAYNDNYDDLVLDDENDSLDESVSSLEPEIGDVAVLKIKLRNANNANKYIYNGYERRPILIISVNDSNFVDALEITHLPKYNGKDLICIGAIKRNDQDSYVNIYTYNDYTNLPVEYEFPAGFDKDTKQPLTRAEYEYRRFGTLCSNPDRNEIYIKNFNYNRNYKETLPDDLVDEILDKLDAYRKNKKIW